MNLRGLGPAVTGDGEVAHCRPRKRRPIMPIDCDRLVKQPQSLDNPFFRYWKEDRPRPQEEIVGGEVDRWPRGGAAHLGGFQCRLNNASDADRNLVLEVE